MFQGPTLWLDNAPLYVVMLIIIVYGFAFAAPGTSFAAFAVAVFLFWMVGIYRFASARQARLQCIQALQQESHDIAPAVLEQLAQDLAKPLWAIC